MTDIRTRTKLIETALPLDAINAASAREKSIRHGHPSTLHLWWARRPLAAARAVIFAQLVDDPAAVPEEFPTPEAQEQERERLFDLIRRLVPWESTTDEAVLAEARAEIWKSWRRACADNAGHPRAAELFDPGRLPALADPFAGGGTIPLEAQRLGLEAWAGDLNPVAVLINKAMVEIPPRFAGLPPVNPRARSENGGVRSENGPDGVNEDDDALSGDDGLAEGHARGAGNLPAGGDGSLAQPHGRSQPDAHGHAPQPPHLSPPLTPHSSPLFPRHWKGAEGLAEDVRYYGEWMRNEAGRRIGHLYPKVTITPDLAAGRPDLQPYLGRELTVIAWIWARTVPSPNPAYRHVQVPLASSFLLSAKAGKQAWVEPVIENGGYRFTVKTGTPADPDAVRNGTKLSRGSNFRCLLSGVPISPDYIKAEGRAGRMGARLMAIVAEGDRGRVYLPPLPEHEQCARLARPTWKPDVEIAKRMTGGNCTPYGLTTFGDLFTDRQLVALTTFSDLVGAAKEQARRDAIAAGLPDDGIPLRDGGTGALAYAEAIAVYLAFAVDRLAMTNNQLARWNAFGAKVQHSFGRQALPMIWDFAEANFFAGATGSVEAAVFYSSDILNWMPACGHASAEARDAMAPQKTDGIVISTDPPYYDNIGYADLSDFFYGWLRRALREVYPDLFATVAVPKAEELVATPYRHGGKEAAERFFREGMERALRNLAARAHPAFPVTIYYAYKQTETKGAGAAASTGWETFLEAAIRAGFAVTATWPMRTELSNRMNGMDANALASSIVLACRPRPADAPRATRAQFLQELAAAIRAALPVMISGQVAPVDLAQASIGPGMAVYSRYAEVLRQDGKPVTVRDALQDINAAIAAYRTERTSSFDPETRFCLDFYDQFGFGEAEYDQATVLARAQAVAVDALERKGLLEAGRGRARLRRPTEFPAGAAALDDRPFGGSTWEACLRLAVTLEREGEAAAGELAAALGEGPSARARELAAWLYTIAESRKRTQDALRFNALNASWHEVQQRAAEAARGSQARLI